LALKKRDAEDFIDALKEEIAMLTNEPNATASPTINLGVQTGSAGK